MSLKDDKESNNNSVINEILKELNVNKIKEDDIKCTKLIAKGGQGKVKYGIFKNSEVIIKLLEKQNCNYIIQEITNMVKYKNVYIPKFLGVFENKKYYGLVMEYIDGLNLTKIINYEKQNKITLSLIQKLNYLIQLSSVIDYLNSNNLIHRDLKTDNILIDKLGELKLIDFGISLQGKNIWINIDSPYNSLTPNYMAPEIVYQTEEESEYIIKKNKYGKYKVYQNPHKNNENENNENENNEKWILITDKYDIWTFGIIMCQLFSRCKPWCRNEKENLSDTEVQARIISRLPYPINKFYPLKESIQYSNDINDIIKKCLNFDYTQRPPMKFVKMDLLKIYSKLCNEKSILEYYNQMRLLRIKNDKNNSEFSMINKNENKDEKNVFDKYKVNRKKNNNNEINNIINEEKSNDDSSISLFQDKLLLRVREDNIKLEQEILIKKSIIMNDYNTHNDS